MSASSNGKSKAAKTAEKSKVPQKKKKVESSSDDSSEEEVKVIAPKKKAAAKKAESSSDSSSDESEKPVAKKAASKKAVAKKDSSSDSSSDESEKPAAKKAAPKKDAKMSSDSDDSDSSEEEKPAKKAAKKAESSDDDSSKSSDSEEPKPRSRKASAVSAKSDKKAKKDSSSDDEEAVAEDNGADADVGACPDEHKDKTELFVQSLCFDTTEDGLSAFFAPYGEIVKCKVMRGKAKAFVEFSKHEEAWKALNATNEKVLDGFTIWVEFSGQAAGGYKPGGDAGEATTVFVGNLGFRTERWAIEEFFKSAGTPSDVRIAMDAETQRPRGFAHVEFASNAEATEAMKLAG